MAIGAARGTRIRGRGEYRRRGAGDCRPAHAANSRRLRGARAGAYSAPPPERRGGRLTRHMTKTIAISLSPNATATDIRIALGQLLTPWRWQNGPLPDQVEEW